MKIKKVPFVLSIALSTLLITGATVFADTSVENGMNHMMNGNGMMNMMENGNMGKMIDAMNSPEGQKMINACDGFMESYGEEEETKQVD